MNEKEAKEILNDPKKLLDLFRLFHQLLHIYEAQEMKKQIKNQLVNKIGEQPSKSQETVGLSDNLDVKVFDSNKIEKEV